MQERYLQDHVLGCWNVPVGKKPNSDWKHLHKCIILYLHLICMLYFDRIIWIFFKKKRLERMIGNPIPSVQQVYRAIGLWGSGHRVGN